MSTLQESIMTGRFFVSESFVSWWREYFFVIDGRGGRELIKLNWFRVKDGKISEINIESDSGALTDDCMDVISDAIVNRDIMLRPISISAEDNGRIMRQVWFCSSEDLKKEMIDRMYK